MSTFFCMSLKPFFESVHIGFLLLCNFAFSKILPCCQIRSAYHIRQTHVSQSISKGGVDNLVERHIFRLRDNLLNRGLPTLRLLGKDVHHDEEHQFTLGTHDRVKATTRLVKPLKGPKEPFDVIRGARILIAAECGSQPVTFASDSGDPGRDAPAFLRILGFQSLKASEKGSGITGLGHPFHLPFQEGQRLG